MKVFDDAMVDIAWNNLNFQYTRFKDIDTKGIGIITISGILIALVSKPVPYEFISNTFLITAMMLFLVTIFFGIRTITPREIKTILTKYLIEDFRDKKPKRQIRGLIGTIADAEYKMCKINNAKSNELNYATYFLISSVVMLTLYSFSSFLGV